MLPPFSPLRPFKDAYPLPTAPPKQIERVRMLYRERFGVEITQPEAKEVLERAMQFVYLTELEDALHHLRTEVE